MQKVILAEALARFSDHWSPKVIGDVNDVQIKLVKLKGEFEWHHHEHEDELFLVLSGRMTMRFRDHDVVLNTNDLIIVPRGVEHLPVADDECSVLLVEPKTTLNTGNVVSKRTVRDLEPRHPVGPPGAPRSHKPSARRRTGKSSCRQAAEVIVADHPRARQARPPASRDGAKER